MSATSQPERIGMTNNWIRMEKHGSKWKKLISFSCPIKLHRTLPGEVELAVIEYLQVAQVLTRHSALLTYITLFLCKFGP